RHVEEHDVRPEPARKIDRRKPVLSRRDLVSQTSQELAQLIRGVGVVVHDEDSPPRGRRSSRWERRQFSVDSRTWRMNRQPHDDLTSSSWTFAECLVTAAVQVDQTAHAGERDTEASRYPRCGARALDEEVEDSLSHLRHQTHSVVTD